MKRLKGYFFYVNASFDLGNIFLVNTKRTEGAIPVVDVSQ
jgi:hypothetical protein